MHDDLRNYVVKHFGDKEVVLIVAKTGYLKKDARSVGVKCQYSGTAGRIENGLISVFYATQRRVKRPLLAGHCT